MVSANRYGYTNGMSGVQLKITQEVITLVVFSFFAIFYLKETLEFRHLISFSLLIGAVYFAFSK